MENHKRIAIARALKKVLIFPILLLVLQVNSCSAPKQLLYVEPVEALPEDLQRGKVLFEEYCATCHPNGMTGVGLAIVNKPLPEFLIKFQIRNGVGVMPAFGEDELTDEEVDNIAEYLVYLRKGR